MNGESINSIVDLKAALEKPADGIHKVEFDEFPKVIYVDDAQGKGINAQFGPRLGIAELERLE